MREHKIVVLGSMGAGKSTLVRAVGAGRIVDTDVANTDARSAKAATTVAMDYADVDLPNGDRLRLYGTPGQTRFEFVWPILLAGAAGAVVLVDATSGDAADELQRYLGVVREYAPGVPTVAGLTRADLRPDGADAACAELLARCAHALPVVPLDARDGSQILLLMDLLMSEIEATELAHAHG